MSTVDHLRKHAKRWLKALRGGDPEARARFDRAYSRAPAHPTLRDVQHALARERGHESWVALTRSAAAGAGEDVLLTPLDTAALNGDHTTAQSLIDAGAAITMPAAIVLGRTADVERLVRESPDLVSMTSRRRWAWLLVHASAHASGPALDVLLRTLTRLRAGLSVVNACEDEPPAPGCAAGYTALHAAAFHGNSAAVDVLLSHGANPRARDRETGGTPAAWASRAGHAAIAERLLRAEGRADPDAGAGRARQRAMFLQSACWDEHVHGRADHRLHDRAAQRLLAQDPALAVDSLYTAIVCGERAEVERLVAADPEAARAQGGPRNWTPILYLAYTRFTHPRTLANAVATGQLLLDHGADPNDFYMAGDARYTVLTGIAGEGEQDAPRQPYAEALFALMLERGAEPFDIQVLYNTHFSGDMLWWLELVYAHTAGTPRGDAWMDPEWRMFDMGAYGTGARFVLETAVKKRHVALAEWALAHGASPMAGAARDERFPKHSLYELAVLEGVPEIADLLVRHGAPRSVPVLGERERFLDACLRLDRDQARRLLERHPEYLRSPDPMFAAAQRDRADVLDLLLHLGFPLEAQDRTGKRALHEAAAHNATRAAAFLIERGAEIDPRESAYGATPIGWAAHGDHQEMLALLSRYSRNIWTLCFRGYVERVRELVAADPALARSVTPEGQTLLWWLPDNETSARETVELLLAAGVDASAEDQEGRTAADWARRRGMMDVALRLEQAAAGESRP